MFFEAERRSTMNDQEQTKLDELIEELRQVRDELKVQVHLAKAEATDLWHETEAKWQHLRSQLDKIENGAGDAAKDVGAAAMLAAEEIKNGYERLRQYIKDI
jgi:SMC interacting uncharacterized protein involved in chromosome segregation